MKCCRWDEIKKKHPDKQRMFEEAIQVGAMAMKFVQLLKGTEVKEINEEEMLTELDLKCRQCKYTVMTDQELKKLGYDPCDTCNNLSNWEPKEDENEQSTGKA